MKNIIEKILRNADVELNGTRPWDIQIHDQRFFQRLFHDKSLGLGESYVERWWDCKSIDQFIYHLLTAEADKLNLSPKNYLDILLHKIFNFQSKTESLQVANIHYNLGNDLYEKMLDQSMNYSCGFWENAKNLEEAQQQKLELICHKLMLKPGMRVLDIGCGWGSFAKYAAEHYKVEVIGITISSLQEQYGSEQCKNLPVKIILEDYRDFSNGEFDRIVSIGMFEHVGYKNYHKFMEIVRKNLKDDGIFLLHTIGSNTSVCNTDPWIDKYIFPNGVLPSIAQIGESIENQFVMEDWHNFGADYDKTLCAWYQNFNTHWPQLKHNRDEQFLRMWNYYLLSCAGAFRARKLQLWQIVLTKSGLPGGFHSRMLDNPRNIGLTIETQRRKED